MPPLRHKPSILVLPFLALLASCGSAGDGEDSTNPAEVKRKAEWLQRYASEKPQEAERYSAECQKEVGLSMTKAGALAFIDCVEKKSKNGAPSPDAPAARP
jgi:hypothetical protein